METSHGRLYENPSFQAFLNHSLNLQIIFYKYLSDACTVKVARVDFHHQFHSELYNHQPGYDTNYQSILI